MGNNYTEWAYSDHMTWDMINNLLDLKEIEKEYAHCHEKYIAARDAALIKLPATAASGEPVVHGARLVVENIAEYWKQRRDIAGKQLPREFLLKFHGKDI